MSGQSQSSAFRGLRTTYGTAAASSMPRRSDSRASCSCSRPAVSASTSGRNSDRLERLLQAVEGVGFAHDANAGVAGEFLGELGFAPPARNDDWEMRVRLAKPGRDLIAILIGQPDVDDQPGDIGVLDLDKRLRGRPCLLG